MPPGIKLSPPDSWGWGAGMDRVTQQGTDTRGKEQVVTQRNMKEKAQPNQMNNRPVLLEKLNQDKKQVFSYSPVRCLQFRSVVSNSLQPCGLQHTRLPCPLLSPGVYSN